MVLTCNRSTIWAEEINEFITTKLKLKFSKCSVFHTYQGVDFLGYRHFKGYLYC